LRCSAERAGKTTPVSIICGSANLSERPVMVNGYDQPGDRAARSLHR